MRNGWTRRRVLRGAAGGTAALVGLPLLEIFLNGNGDALASGAPLPRRFGTWFWGCGMNPARWNPETVGSDFALPPELEPIASVREHVNVLSGMSTLLSGEPNHVHFTGIMGTLTGEAPPKPKLSDLPTVDVLIADEIGQSTRFRSLEMAATGMAKHSYSQRGASVQNPGEVSALALYQRVFGDGFTDPNEADWKPDPRVMLRKSALSAVKEDREALARDLGAADRARLDEYFTALRQLEQQLEIQLSKPPPLEACSVPAAPESPKLSMDVDDVSENHRLMARVLAFALACDQTRVFNMVFSNRASGLHRAGSSDTHHTLTHEEPRDEKLGYQVAATDFVVRSMEAFATFVETLASVPEGDGTLLDNCLVLAHSESSDANTHSVTGLPVMLAGRAGGRMKTGFHVRSVGDSTSRVSLTVQQLMGLRVGSFGYRQNATSRPISEVVV